MFEKWFAGTDAASTVNTYSAGRRPGRAGRPRHPFLKQALSGAGRKSGDGRTPFGIVTRGIEFSSGKHYRFAVSRFSSKSNVEPRAMAGSTGDSPVPRGDPPHGMTPAFVPIPASTRSAGPAAVLSGQLPRRRRKLNRAYKMTLPDREMQFKSNRRLRPLEVHPAPTQKARSHARQMPNWFLTEKPACGQLQPARCLRGDRHICMLGDDDTYPKFRGLIGRVCREEMPQTWRSILREI